MVEDKGGREVAVGSRRRRKKGVSKRRKGKGTTLEPERRGGGTFGVAPERTRKSAPRIVAFNVEE